MFAEKTDDCIQFAAFNTMQVFIGALWRKTVDITY